ncbi:MAG: CaiB/BaiF CoA-transferase family protein [Dehalococcoidales bacterium]|nr:CaiB/BaiF CoA-transferase family protein [Dehalococcoidales bacterium]
MTDLPLAGIRVIDLSRVLAGPYCTMMLGDLGAEVIKIEMPRSGDDTRRYGPPFVGGESAYYLFINRNKKGITLNLKTDEGKRILIDLVRKGDILVENFKLGTLERMGLGFDYLHEINPGLIQCTVSGYGREGPCAHKPGYDFVIQAEAGIMSFTGEPDGQPMKVGVAIVDMTTGMFATSAILAALHQRHSTGLGQLIDVSLFDSALAWLGNVGSNYLVGGGVPGRLGNTHPSIVPYQSFKAGDRYIAVAVGNDHQFRRFCQVIGRPELADDPRFMTNARRVENRGTLVPMIQEVIGTGDADEWLAALEAAGIPSGSINTLDRVFAHPQTVASGAVQEVPHPTLGTVKLVGPPYRFANGPLPVRSHPPLLGEHTEEVLTGLLGYSADEVRSLREKGVV